MTSTIPYMYLFIRKDLSIPQQIVQTAHAVDEIGRTYARSRKTNHMVLIGAEDERELLDIGKYLEECGIKHHTFYEPDINGHTAIATEPLVGDDRIPMRVFRLLK